MNPSALVAALLTLLPLVVNAEPPEDALARVHRLENSVLAPCCYTEPVGRHQSEIAVRMRVEIAKWVAQGKTDREILAAYTGQYGAKVLVDPRTIPQPWAVYVPWAIAALAGAGLAWALWRWRSTQQIAVAPASAAPLPDVPDFDD